MGISAGAKFTVMRWSGKSPPLFLIAERTLSFASSTALLGKPTMLKAGKLREETSTSTSTKIDSRPIVAPEKTRASINLL